MHIEQAQWTADGGWRRTRSAPESGPAHVVLVFGERAALAGSEALRELRDAHPDAVLIGCSTAGEIRDTHILDGSIVATALRLERTTVRPAHVFLDDVGDSLEAGRTLGRALTAPDLVHVLVFSDGLRVNGSALVRGLEDALPEGVSVSGGLAGDAARFESTLVCLEGEARSGAIAALGFHGTGLRVGCASLGGWDTFGPDRLVTRSAGNVLHELDGRPALSLYKTYLGPYAAELPSSGLLFPLSVATDGGGAVVRTILGVDETEGSITFAGDIPHGSYARLMKANLDRLIDGASRAGTTSRNGLEDAPPELAILISCVGRKLVLGQRTEEEIESVREAIGDDAVLTGFYSYGEISPFNPSTRCALHNQTMTVTMLSEC